MTVDEAIEIAIAHHQAGRLREAERLYRQVLEVAPGCAEAWQLLGVLAGQVGRADAAMELLGRAIQLRPDFGEAYSNLGYLLTQQHRYEESEAACRRAAELAPMLASAHNNLGDALRNVGKLEESVAACRRAVELNPQFAEAYNNLGNALSDRGQRAEAIAAYRRSIELRPDLAETYDNLGTTLRDEGRLDEALAACRRAIALNPEFATAYSSLGGLLAMAGLHDEGLAAERRATMLKPAEPVFHSCLIYSMHYHPGCDARDIAREQALWNERHAKPLARHIRPHVNSRDPERRLRVGYVSPDFYGHPVGRFISPLLAHHDRGQVEVYCYANVVRRDWRTELLRGQADHWRDIFGATDERAAEMIRADGIDILMDLAMHTSHNRLPLFARKPAPVQATYLAYASGTGVETIDYRLTDPQLDPPENDSLYTEKSVRLPRTYWCYEALFTEAVGELPALGGRGVTFGCLNNFAKVTEPALVTWCRVLRAVPESRLVLSAREGAHRQRVGEVLEREGVDRGRLSFVPWLATSEYFRKYNEIDIALDTIPYAGATTTCDALWMGVPVVTLAGSWAISRGGLSVLSNIGLTELVAYSPEEYVKIAAELARDLPRLAELRRTLRERMESSAVMDHAGFARDVEEAYRGMWRQWCAGDGKRG